MYLGVGILLCAVTADEWIDDQHVDLAGAQFGDQSVFDGLGDDEAFAALGDDEFGIAAAEQEAVAELVDGQIAL